MHMSVSYLIYNLTNQYKNLYWLTDHVPSTFRKTNEFIVLFIQFPGLKQRKVGEKNKTIAACTVLVFYSNSAI